MATGNGALYHDGNLFIDSEGIGSVRLYDKAITLTDLSDNPLPAMVSVSRMVTSRLRTAAPHGRVS